VFSIPCFVRQFHVSPDGLHKAIFDRTFVHFGSTTDEFLQVVAVVTVLGFDLRIWHTVWFFLGIFDTWHFARWRGHINIVFGNVEQMFPQFFPIIFDGFALWIELLYQIDDFLTELLAHIAVGNGLRMAYQLLHIASVFGHDEFF
jgi:hypothetical protein